MLAGKAFQSLAAVNANVDDPGPRTRGTTTPYSLDRVPTLCWSLTRGEKR